MNKILIFRTGQLGDTLIAVPALRVLKRRFPDAQIDLLYDVHPEQKYVSAEAILSGSGLIDRFIPYPVASSGLRRFGAYLLTFWRLLSLRRGNYDCVVILTQSPRSEKQMARDQKYFRMLAGIGVSYLIPPSPRPMLMSNSKYEYVAVNEAEYLQQTLLEQLGIRHQKLEMLRLESTKLEVDKVKQWLADNTERGLEANLVGVALGSKMQSKIWPSERYGEVLIQLWERDGVWPIFLGGAADVAISQALSESIGIGTVACGAFNLRESLALLSQCRFFLGNDTGTMHLAVAAGIKCVGVFSARDVPGKWYPYGEGHIVLRKDVSCQGCMLEVCEEQAMRCLLEITSDEVLESCERALLQSN